MRLCLLLFALPALAADIAGTWHAWVLNPKKEKVLFTLEIDGRNGNWHGTLVNGRDRQRSTGGTFDGTTLRLEFAYWDAVLEAKLAGGQFEGQFTRRYRKTTLVRPFGASKRAPLIPAGPPGANVTGEWILEMDDEEKSVVRAQFHQQEKHLTATLIPVSGDSGEMTGWIANGEIRLHHFDGIRATLLVARIDGGTLEGLYNSTVKVSGMRAAESGIKPPDAHTYTRMKNPREPFRFSYPDLNGKRVSSTDARFKGKVVLVTITGSWCPNCHDEAPFLNELYTKYQARGLEIVALGFEYTGETERDLRQLRRFVEKHDVRYPVLLCGTTESAPEQLSQLENFGAYPTAIYIGRDGLVKSIHAGFDGPATGDRYVRLKKELTELIEHLLEAAK